jgi:hypothetical protein
MADLGVGASLVFLLVSSCLILEVFCLLWICWFGYNLWHLFWITFSLEFWYGCHVLDPSGKHSGLAALVFQDDDHITGAALLKITQVIFDFLIWVNLISCVRIFMISYASLDYDFTFSFHGSSLS